MTNYVNLLDFLPELIGLFVTSFLAATLLPGGSEVVLLALITTHPETSVVAVIVATAGNTLGGITNWCLGRYLIVYQDRKWFPITPKRLAQVHRIFERYGQWTLLFSWLPIIGDAVCLVAGVAKLSLTRTFVWVLIGKAARYTVLVYGTNTFLLS